MPAPSTQTAGRAGQSRRWAPALAGMTTVLVLSGCGLSGTELSDGASSEDIDAGQVAYERDCSDCHGIGGQGTRQGPPFIDKIYEPSHHSDGAFVQAVKRGVPAHHWNFGDMPPQPGVSDREIVQITAYVRGLQREAGID